MAERARKGRQRKGANGQLPLGDKGKRGKKKAAGPGHNSGDVPDETYNTHLASIQAKRVLMEKAQATARQKAGEYRNALKLAKDDGCNTEAMILAHNLDKQDTLEVAMLYREAGRVLRLTESRLATQLNLFADVNAPEPENPVLAGEAAGKRGDPREQNPHLPGSEAFALYDTAWQQGQATIAATLGRG